MDQERFYDITEVCRLLGTTSRTLRFYEEKGIIQSTTLGTSARRRYTEDQLARIKNVFVLRTLGLSVHSIAELQAEENDLKNAVLSRRAEIYARMDTYLRELNLLNEALSALECGKPIFDGGRVPEDETEEKQILRDCAEAVVSGDVDRLYRHLSLRLIQYMPKDVYVQVRKDTLLPLGDFLSLEKICSDEKLPNKQYCFLKYSRLGLKITVFFYGGKIDGLWLGYYDTNVGGWK